MVRTHAGTRNFNHVAKQQEPNQVIERERKPMIVRQVSFLSLINACDVVNGKLMGFRDPKKQTNKQTRRDGAPLLKDTETCALCTILLQVSLSLSFPPTFLGMAYDCRLKWGEKNKTSDIYTLLKGFYSSPSVSTCPDFRDFSHFQLNVTIEEETYPVTDPSLSRIQNQTTKQKHWSKPMRLLPKWRCEETTYSVITPHAPQRRRC